MRCEAPNGFFYWQARMRLLPQASSRKQGGAIFGKKKFVPIIWDLQPNELPRWITDYQGLVLTDTNMENINQQVSQLAASVKASKENAQLVAAAVFAVGLFVLSK
jgi:hypothetical protein